MIVLAGSDRRQGSVPVGMHSADMLAGFKGMLPLPGGKVLVGELIEQFVRSGRFRDPVLVGPASVYAGASPRCEIVDCDGSIAETLQSAVRVIESRFGAEVPVALTSCDVLPSADELEALLAAHYDPVSDCVFWGVLIEAEAARMGASGWKPSYRLAGGEAGGPLNLYPGHLTVVRVGALDVAVTTTLVGLAYQYRNRALLRRVPGMLAHGVVRLARHDFRRLRRLSWSAAAFNVPWQCLRAYARYQHGRLDVDGLERAFTKTLIRPGYREAAAGHPVRFVMSRTLSLAKDLDTRAEFDELVRARTCDSD